MANVVDRAGRYKAVISDFGLSETKDSKIPVFTIEFHPTEYFEAGQWQDWKQYQTSIRGYFHPFRKDGLPNETGIKQLVNALGWDGLSLKDLQEGDWNGKQVQIVVKAESYQGEEKLKVAWLDPFDFSPTLRKVEEKELKAMASTWDSKLRAVNGGKAKPAASKKAS